MKRTRQQREAENIVDTLMAEIIDTMAQSQPMHSLKVSLLQQLRLATRQLEQVVAEGDYVYDGY